MGSILVRRYRTRIGILLDILSWIHRLDEPTITTLITYTNVPHDRIKGILRNLEEKGVVRRIQSDDHFIYVLTERGYRLLRDLERIKKSLEGLGIPI